MATVTQENALQHCEDILEYANSPQGEGLDPKFVESLQRDLQNGKKLTYRQLEAIENIYERFKIWEQ